MKSLCLSMFVVAALCALSLAQDASSPSPQAPNANQAPAQSTAAGTQPAGSIRIAPGSVIPVELTKTVDAKKAKVGDPVEAKVMQDMKTNTGELIVPKDTKVVGHVTEAQARSKEQKESQMGITFDRATTKDGRDMNLPMSIQAIIGPQTSNPGAANNPNSDNSAGASPTGASGYPGAGGRGTPTGGGSAGASPSNPSAGGGEASGTPRASSTSAINGNTQGVVGIPDLTLSNAGQASTGSVITSEKKNVKLESGTMMLLRVNPSNP